MTVIRNRAMPRSAGVLLHPTSLPGPYGIGDLGAPARAFVDWLAVSGMRLWQILPLVPTGHNGSPYSSWSAFAGNPDLVALDELVALGLLAPSDLPPPAPASGPIDYAAARALRRPALAKAVQALLRGGGTLAAELSTWKEHVPWVAETALFASLKEREEGKPWWEWPATLRDRKPAALAAAARELRTELDNAVAMQFLFARQWQALRAYAASKGVTFIGDVPIYVDGDSADVWAGRELFELGRNGRPERVSGVPPDAFSATGQRWGNPLYRWDKMANDGFAWWQTRLRRSLELTDWVRIDHFRGLSAYWAVPADAPDARSGAWVTGPGLALFDALHNALGSLPVIAEDLGVIDDNVRALLAAADLPGMKVLQFAFGETAINPYLPHNHTPQSVVYTGTHDNDTTRGWWHSQPEHVRHHVRVYLSTPGDDIAWDFIRAALASVARFAIIPMQDVLSLDRHARMNTPSVSAGNWRWRLAPGDLKPEVARRLRHLVELFGREGV